MPRQQQPLDLSRGQILAQRRRVQALDSRLPMGEESLQRAAWAGLQDSVPRSALLSIHARVEATPPTILEHPSLVQLWGPRFSAYVVTAADRALFTRARLPQDARGQRYADLAARLHAYLAGETSTLGQAGKALGLRSGNTLRYAALTGSILMHWDGARQPTLWSVPTPDLEPQTARLQLAQRYLHFFGPTTPEAFAEWAGLSVVAARATFTALDDSLTPVRSPVGDAWILANDEPGFRAPPVATSAIRLLPSGDTYFLLQGANRELLVPRIEHRRLLWTSRVWPGAILVRDEIVGTWRRAEHKVTLEPWQQLSSNDRDALEAEARTLPLPGLHKPVVVRWTALSPE